MEGALIMDMDMDHTSSTEDMTPAKAFGAWLRTLRKSRKLTQVELAALLELKQGDISRRELEGSIQATELVEWARVLEYPIEHFYKTFDGWKTALMPEVNWDLQEAFHRLPDSLKGHVVRFVASLAHDPAVTEQPLSPDTLLLRSTPCEPEACPPLC